jgi:hypothetical protein
MPPSVCTNCKRICIKTPASPIVAIGMEAAPHVGRVVRTEPDLAVVAVMA